MTKEYIEKIGKDILGFVGLLIISFFLYEFIDWDGRFLKAIEKVWTDYIRDEGFWMICGLAIVGRLIIGFVGGLFKIVINETKKSFQKLQKGKAA